LTDGPLTVATRNPGKIREIRKILKGLPFKIQAVDEVFSGPGPVEKALTFAENAEAKAVFYSNKIPGLVVADDSGLEVDSLGGAPGVFSARFSRPRPTDEKNIKKLLHLMAGVPAEKRGARFVAAIALARHGKVIKVIEGTVRGRILTAPRGFNGFGYDPVFYYARFKKTFAELRPAEKNEVSHRGRALKRLRQYLQKRLAAGLPLFSR